MHYPHPSFVQDEHGIFIPLQSSAHRGNEYDESGFDMLMRMQREHFWYRGRHDLILKVLSKEVSKRPKNKELRAIDMGGGCGGWLEYLHTKSPTLFREVALADSSLNALAFAEPVVSSFAHRYQIDLLDLPWQEEWDIVFLLDVLEHIPDHVQVIKEIYKTLRPGGLLFITTPALKFFWTYNDEVVHHQRRYSKDDFRSISSQTTMKLLRAEYFMFFLSPALFLSRLLVRPPVSATPEQMQAHIEKTHDIPPKIINALLTRIFSVEASLINHVGFPWGTSILAVLQK